jgi:translation initiation factor 1
MGRRSGRGDEGGEDPAASGSGLGSFGALLQARGLAASEAASAPPPSSAAVGAPASVFSWASLPKVVLRMERKGRGGKAVTVVQGVPPRQLDEAAGTLRRAFGTGARVEEEEIVVQGDLRERLRTWLHSAGVRDVRG